MPANAVLPGSCCSGTFFMFFLGICIKGGYKWVMHHPLQPIHSLGDMKSARNSILSLFACALHRFVGEWYQPVIDKDTGEIMQGSPTSDQQNKAAGSCFAVGAPSSCPSCPGSCLLPPKPSFWYCSTCLMASMKHMTTGSSKIRCLVAASTLNTCVTDDCCRWVAST